MSLFIHLVYNGDMKADGNSLVCVEKSDLGSYVYFMFPQNKRNYATETVITYFL